MARKPVCTDEARARALVDLEKAKTADHLRAAQAVLLPDRGYSLEETAALIGRDRFWVARTRNRYIRGDKDFSQPSPRGGDKNRLLTEEQEMEAVMTSMQLTRRSWGRSNREFLRQQVAKVTGKDAAESTITAINSRVAEKLLAGGKTWEMERRSTFLLEAWQEEARLRAKMTKNERENLNAWQERARKDSEAWEEKKRLTKK